MKSKRGEICLGDISVIIETSRKSSSKYGQRIIIKQNEIILKNIIFVLYEKKIIKTTHFQKKIERETKGKIISLKLQQYKNTGFTNYDVDQFETF